MADTLPGLEDRREHTPAPPGASEIMRGVMAWAKGSDVPVAPRTRAWLAREIRHCLVAYEPETIMPAAVRIVKKGLNPSLLATECSRVLAEFRPKLTYRELEEIMAALSARGRTAPFWWQMGASSHAKATMQMALHMQRQGQPQEVVKNYVEQQAG